MGEEGGIVQRSNIRHFPRTQKQECPVWKSRPSDQSNERTGIISRFHIVRDNEKILKASEERNPVNTKEWKWEWHQISQEQHQMLKHSSVMLQNLRENIFST